MNRRVSLFIAIVLSWISLIWLWPKSIFFFCFDDAFYYFEIAQRLSQGQGATFDGLNYTNGFHPLWLLLCVPVFWAGLAGTIAVQLILSLQFALAAVMLFLLLKPVITKQVAAGSFLVIIIVSVIIHPFLVKVFVNGLESVLYCFILALLLRQLTSIGDNEPGLLLKRVAFHSLLVSLAFLARTDALFLWISIFGIQLWQVSQFGSKILKPFLRFWILPATTAVIYFSANYYYFGVLTQVSGQLKRVPLHFDNVSLSILVFAVLVAFAAKAARSKNLSRTALFTRQTFVFVPFLACLISYYSFLQGFKALWYFAPVVLYLLSLFITFASDLLEQAGSDLKTRSKIGLLLAMPFFLSAMLSWRSFASSGSIQMGLAHQSAAKWISEHLPPQAILASWDAGILGFYTKQPVVNVDGVVNSAQFLEALKTRTAGLFLRNQQVAWLVNHTLNNADSERKEQLELDAFFASAGPVHFETIKSWPFQFYGMTNRHQFGQHDMAVFLRRIEFEN